jgi:uncharacterized protein YaaQ
MDAEVPWEEDVDHYWDDFLVAGHWDEDDDEFDAILHPSMPLPPICAAARDGDVPGVEAQLRRDPGCANAHRNRDRKTALMFAAAHREHGAEMARVLLAAGARAGQLVSFANDGCHTALEYACYSGSLATGELLLGLEEARVDTGRSLLGLACQNEDAAVLCALLRDGAFDPDERGVNGPDYFGLPLTAAVRFARAPAAAALLEVRVRGGVVGGCVPVTVFG